MRDSAGSAKTQAHPCVDIDVAVPHSDGRYMADAGREPGPCAHGVIPPRSRERHFSQRGGRSTSLWASTRRASDGTLQALENPSRCRLRGVRRCLLHDGLTVGPSKIRHCWCWWASVVTTHWSASSATTSAMPRLRDAEKCSQARGVVRGLQHPGPALGPRRTESTRIPPGHEPVRAAERRGGRRGERRTRGLDGPRV